MKILIPFDRLSNAKAAVASAVAQRALGSAPRAKRGLPAGRLSVLNGDQSAVTAFSANYSDAGLLGVFVVGTPSKVGDLTRKAADTLREANVAEEDVSRAKNVLKADIGIANENEAELAEDLGLQSLLTGKAHTFAEISALIDSVTAADVNNVSLVSLTVQYIMLKDRNNICVFSVLGFKEGCRESSFSDIWKHWQCTLFGRTLNADPNWSHTEYENLNCS